MKALGLNKDQRLKSKKQIDRLFAKGNSFTVYPFRVLYQWAEPENAPVRFGVSVSKRIFKKAVDRNRLKRMTREAFRLQKEGLEKAVAAKGLGLELFFIYIHRGEPEFENLYAKAGSIIKKLIDGLNEDSKADT
ncbi:MAG: ribonuclease P protein component [Chitinophagaceae bacterium]|uniref:ribonuclease P protein component n=1 Tax=unclassified Paraflavitalea TaxID=2798305 RepID=UPI003D34A5D2|nr:ribonuclease P protein component [Chitinophagaceae bacterium]